MKIAVIGMVLVAIILVATLSAIGCGGAQPEAPSEEAPSEEAPGEAPTTEKLEILSHEMITTEDGGKIVQGTARNVSGSMFHNATIRVKFYDASGTFITGSLDTIVNLGAGETWDFEMTCWLSEAKNVASYKIAVGECW